MKFFLISALAVLVISPLAALSQKQPRVDSGFPIPEMTPKRADVKPFEYEDVGKKIPNYKAGKGQTLNLMQKPLSADESMKHIVVPKGFHAELVVADPQIRRPICMNWDERGRLWIIESVDYPHDLGKGSDRIVICEDTKGTGRPDKFTVFAEKLSIPTSLIFYKGGVIVHNGTETIYLKDTDGDGKADVRKTLFGRWAQGDTHGGPSNLNYGLDNWIWGMQGYNNSKLTVGGETHAFRQGFYRFKPDGSKLEFIRSTNNNTWGIGFSEEGLVFGSTANRNPSVFMPIPNRYYEAVKGWKPASLQAPAIADTHFFKPITTKVRQVDQFGGYTAAAGHALYTARNYPKEYWNRTAFVTEPTGHLVGTFVLRQEGSHFRSNNSFNLMASDDEWTSPIMAEVGPDGNVWVIDWYNYIIQHNPTPQGFKTGKGAAYETDLRDKTHGRVYRIVYDGKTPEKTRFTLEKATPEKLVATLKHDNLFWRRHAQRLLVERGQLDVVPGLIALAKDPGVDPIGLNVGAIHALWTLQGLGALDGKHPDATAAAVAALKHPSPGVRRNAVQVLPRTPESTQAIVDAGLTTHADPHVRLATLLALADLPPTQKAGAAIVEVLARGVNAKDRWIPEAATSAAANNSEHFLRGLGEKKEAPTSKLLEIATIVADHYARGGPTDSVGGVIAKLADADTTAAEAVIRGLARGWPSARKPQLTEQLERDLARLANRLGQAKRTPLVQLAGAWGSKRFEELAAEIPKLLLARVTNDKLSTEERSEAARELIDMQPRDKKAVVDVLELITPRTPPDLAAGLLQALERTDVPEAGTHLVERMPTYTPAVRIAALRVILPRPAWTIAFLERVEKGKLSLGELALDQKQALATHPNTDIRRQANALLERGDALPDPDRVKAVETILALAQVKGDPGAGKLVYKNVCAKCHVHGTEGTRIGPDLTGMAAHPKEELVVHIIDPSRSVEGNFRISVVTTTKGLVLTGLLASESKTAIELFDAEGKKQTILREDIETIANSTKSLMPDGFEKVLKKHEMTDLLEFLAQRGKYLPLPLDRVASAVSTRGLLTDDPKASEKIVLDDWNPRTIEGVPFQLVDPRGDRVPNVVLLFGPGGNVPPKMPKSVSLPVNTPAKAIHVLGGVGLIQSADKGATALIVRLHYDDGKSEDHALKIGEHILPLTRKGEAPGSKLALESGGNQVRYLAVRPQRPAKIERIELIAGPADVAPLVLAITVETGE